MIEKPFYSVEFHVEYDLPLGLGRLHFEEGGSIAAARTGTTGGGGKQGRRWHRG